VKLLLITGLILLLIFYQYWLRQGFKTYVEDNYLTNFFYFFLYWLRRGFSYNFGRVYFGIKWVVHLIVFWFIFDDREICIFIVIFVKCCLMIGTKCPIVWLWLLRYRIVSHILFMLWSFF